MDTLLKYDLISDPFPLQASAKGKTNAIAAITIVATNRSPDPVTLHVIEVRIPIGNGASELTNNSKSIVSLPPPGWEKKPPRFDDGHIILIFAAQGHRLPADQSLNFVFTGIMVNDHTGAVDITLTEISSACQMPDCPQWIRSITKYPNGWGNVDFCADPADVDYGGQTMLSWRGPEGATYKISYSTEDHGVTKRVTIPATSADPPLGSQGIYGPITLKDTTQFTMLVVEEVNEHVFHVQTQKTVVVGDAPFPVINEFKADKYTLDLALEPKVVELTWNVSGADHIEINGVDVTAMSIYKVLPWETTTFRLVATIQKQRVSKEIVVWSYRDFLLNYHFTLHDVDESIDTCSSPPGTVHRHIQVYESLVFRGDGTGYHQCRITGYDAYSLQNGSQYNVDRTASYDKDFTWGPNGDNKVLIDRHVPNPTVPSLNYLRVELQPDLTLAYTQPYFDYVKRSVFAFRSERKMPA